MTPTDFVLDVDRLALDPDGVKGFLWPLARSEAIAMRDATASALVAVARPSADSDQGKELLSIVFPPLLVEIMGLYQAHALNRRFRALDRRMATSHNAMIQAMATGNRIPPSSELAFWKRGLPRARSGFKRNLWLARLHLQWDGLSPRLLRSFDRRREIAAIQTLPLIERRARSVSEFVRYVDRGQWFGPLEDQPSHTHVLDTADRDAIVSGVVDAAHVGFAAGNEQIPPLQEEYLRCWLKHALTLAGRRLTALLARPGDLPLQLWTGTGGSVWNRILRHAVQRLGGKVTGHDHGAGDGHLNYPYHTLMEFESCDTFVTFTADNADALRKNLRRDLLIQKDPPRIIGAPQPGGTSDLNVYSARARRPIRSVIYPSSFYTGGQPAYSIRVPDLVAADWEARLFWWLRQWEFEVLHKPHPSSVALPPSRFLESIGGKLLTDRFEQVLDLADAVILLSPQSSTTVPILASNKPIVFIDVGLVPWTPEAYEMLSRRCAIVHGWFDSDNRIQVEWDELRKALDASVRLDDRTIARTYWGV